MQVQVWQAALFGLLACLASMPGLGGTVLGNYTLRGHSGRIHRARNAGRHGFR